MRFTALFFLGLAFSHAHAQATSVDEPITTVRPRVTDTTRIVPVGRTQVETGSGIYFGGGLYQSFQTYDPILVRYGLSPRLEVRLETPTFTGDRFGLPSRLDDLSIAASYFLGRAGRVALAVSPRLTLPTANTPYHRLTQVTPSLFLTGEARIGKGWTVSSSFGYVDWDYTYGQGSNRTRFQYDVYRASLAVERALGKRASVFIEYAGVFYKDFQPSHTVNLGARLRLSHRDGIDVRFMPPVANGPIANTAAVGYSVRF